MWRERVMGTKNSDHRQSGQHPGSAFLRTEPGRSLAGGGELSTCGETRQFFGASPALGHDAPEKERCARVGWRAGLSILNNLRIEEQRQKQSKSEAKQSKTEQDGAKQSGAVVI